MAKKKKPGATSAAAAASTLNQLTVAKLGQAPSDGRLEVAVAIASVTNLVTVDGNANPFTTVPDDLFDLKFNDPKVGLTDELMRVVKAILKKLLPIIASDIDQIPENANLNIEQVAEFVRLSLLAASVNR